MLLKVLADGPVARAPRARQDRKLEGETFEAMELLGATKSTESPLRATFSTDQVHGAGGAEYGLYSNKHSNRSRRCQTAER
jgi:hypothetical protein